jgi:hypothetical protein
MAENKAAPHSFVKDRVYYFIRRVPNDLRHHDTSPKISYSLRTRSVTVAASRAVRVAQKLDEYWYHLGMNDSDLPGKHMLRIAVHSGVAPSVLLTRLALDHRGAFRHAPSCKDSADPESNKITTTKLAVHGHVEQREVARIACHLETNPDGPDAPWPERAFLADYAALVPKAAGRL